MYVVAIYDCCRSTRDGGIQPRRPTFEDNLINIYGCPPSHALAANSTLCVDIFTWLNNKA